MIAMGTFCKRLLCLVWTTWPSYHKKMSLCAQDSWLSIPPFFYNKRSYPRVGAATDAPVEMWGACHDRMSLASHSREYEWYEAYNLDTMLIISSWIWWQDCRSEHDTRLVLFTVPPNRPVLRTVPLPDVFWARYIRWMSSNQCIRIRATGTEQIRERRMLSRCTEHGARST